MYLRRLDCDFQSLTELKENDELCGNAEFS